MGMVYVNNIKEEIQDNDMKKEIICKEQIEKEIDIKEEKNSAEDEPKANS